VPVKIPDWEQLDEEQLQKLPPEQVRALVSELATELIKVREKLKATSPAGSVPRSGKPPWSGVER